MSNEQKLRALLADLGKSTLRGVRRCPKCGTLNGIRGLSCKNKACDVVFKEAGEKRKHSTEVCKIITGTTTQIFSVRVRDKGPDYRGFVQFPMLQPSATDSVTALIIEATALCFVDTCQRTFNTNVLKCHEKEIPVDTSCQHIQAALRCYSEAQPLTLSNAVVASLKVPTSIKQAIWQLAIEAVGPVVQRVSKTVMVVKCKVTSKHPLGYLHVSFFLAKNKESQSHYICGCPMYKGQLKNGGHADDVLHRRCIHYYACIAAFVDDRKLSQEFAFFIELEQPLDILNLQLDNHSQEKDDEVVVEEEITTQSQNQLVAILNNVADYCKVEMEVLPEETEDMLSLALPDQIVQDEEYQSTVDELNSPGGHDGHINLQELEVIHDLDTTSDSQIETTTIVVDQNCLNEVLKLAQSKVSVNQKTSGKQILSSLELPGMKRKRDETQTILQESSKKLSRKQRNLPVKTQVKELDESSVSQTFIQWLASVTERINQTMHFQFNGKPPPLVFHAPQDFFDCLRERISFGGRKKRLPNETTAFVRRNSLPIGTFTKYTWRINNVIHCKQIFETSLVPLAITRSFVENRDGTYEPYEAISQKDEAYSKMDNAPHIKPLELKTFLKVGHTTPDQQNPTPLIIEWTPDILPISRVGELKITFEFGHQRP